MTEEVHRPRRPCGMRAPALARALELVDDERADPGSRSRARESTSTGVRALVRDGFADAMNVSVGDEHLVAGRDAEQAQRDVDRGGAARAGDRVARADVARRTRARSDRRTAPPTRRSSCATHSSR